VVQEVAEITTVLALVRAGLGVSMIPASFSNNRFEEIHTHPISLIPRFLDLLKTKSSE